MSNLIPVNDSPFDSIRRVREDGLEFWSARDLMPLMGYPRWNEFKIPLQRAMKSAEVQGNDVAALFRGSAEKTSGRPREDFHLARFAAYLVAMNGDPNKPEVAAAQAYFAVKTREAEVAKPALPQTYKEALVALLSEVEANEQLEAKNKELEPKAESYDSFMSGEGTFSMGEVGKMLDIGRATLFRLLRNCGVLISTENQKGVPYQKYKHHFEVKAYTVERLGRPPIVKNTTRVRPSGVDFIRRKLGLKQVELPEGPLQLF